MADIQYHIDFDKIIDTARKGVKRATAFLGLGVNAAQDPNFNEYELTRITKLQLLPAELPQDTVNHLKEEFGIWIVGNGFRELVETFSVFLDQVHHACAVIGPSKGKLTVAELAEKQSNFATQGFPNKLNMLQAGYSVAPKHPEYLKTLNKARNCLTHRRGIVGQLDCNEDQRLRVLWLGADIYIEEPSGTKHMIEDLPNGGLYLPEGGDVNMRMVERERQFEIGQLVKLSARDLAEVCWFILREAQATISSAVEFAKAAGVAVKEKKTVKSDE